MSTILLGTSVRSSILSSLFISATAPTMFMGGGSPTQRIAFMSGTMPANADLLGNGNYMSANVLLYWSSSNGFNTSTYRSLVGQSIVLQTPYATATASGTATWLWYMSRQQFVGDTATTSTSRDMMLSVSGPGGGGEVILTSGANIVSGQAYHFNSVILTLPELYTY
jgi:hypothetical protein